MKINKDVLIRFVLLLIFTTVYPIYKYISGKSILMLCDAFTLEGLILLTFGLVRSLFNSGVYTPASYIAQKKFFNYNKSYDVYKEDRKHIKTFNYALYLGLIDVIVSFIISLFI